jgi:hypothetical protein
MFLFKKMYLQIAPRRSIKHTSVRKYWKIPFNPSNTDTGTFYGGSTDIDTDVQYTNLNSDIMVFPVFSRSTLLKSNFEGLLKVGKSQKQFFLKIYFPKIDLNFLKDFCSSF